MLHKLFPTTALMLSLFAAAALVAPAANAAISAPPAIGQTAPSFDLPSVRTSSDISLQSLLAGKKATVVIWVSTRCPITQAYNQRMAALAAEFAPAGIDFVGIDSNKNEPTGECNEWETTSKIGFPVLKDNNNVIADKYGATHTPEVYVIDSRGKLVYHGRIDNAVDPMGAQKHDLAEALDDILANKPIANPDTKAFGCSIKRVD